MNKPTSITITKTNRMVEHYNHDNGTQDIYRFQNGWGASVVCNSMSYGHQKGLKELAVLDKNGNLCYTTPVTNDVIGWLTDEDVEKYLAQIEALPNA